MRSGKLEAAEILTDFESKITKAHFNLVDTTARQVIRSGGLPLHHRDPFDRLLIAQAFDLDVPVLSNETLFDR